MFDAFLLPFYIPVNFFTPIIFLLIVVKRQKKLLIKYYIKFIIKTQNKKNSEIKIKMKREKKENLKEKGYP